MKRLETEKKILNRAIEITDEKPETEIRKNTYPIKSIFRHTGGERSK
jgi:hypothetical protein